MQVRAIWIEWAKEQVKPKPSWLLPWEQLTEAEKEVDRRIGEQLAYVGMRIEREGAAIEERRGGASAAIEPRDQLDSAAQLRAQADELEAEAVTLALKEADGRVSRAAAILGMTHGGLRQLLERGRLRHLNKLAARIDGRPRKGERT